MSANTQILQERRAVQLPAWLVIGVAVAVTGALAIGTMSEREPATRPISGGAVTGEAVAQSDAAEMARLKAAVALRFWAQQHGIATEASGASDAAPISEQKRATAATFGGTPPPKVLYADNTAPVQIDGRLCGQCR